jgi:hypothetical protein
MTPDIAEAVVAGAESVAAGLILGAVVIHLKLVNEVVVALQRTAESAEAVRRVADDLYKLLAKSAEADRG